MSKPLIVTEDEKYLIKLKGAGFSDLQISKKLGISVEAVEQKWKLIEKTFIIGKESGYGAFCDHVTIAAHQYQLLGESFKVIAEVLSGRMSEAELEALIVPDPKQTLKNLQSHCIVLRAFVPVSPAEALSKIFSGN